MLSISNIAAEQATSYYKKDGYYVRNDETEDTWQGKLKDQLGLPNKITKEHFDNLVKIRKERAGFDLCFSAPKSVSIALCLDEFIRQEMIEAHQLAVTATLEKIERREIGARITTDGETEHIKTGNMLCGKFNHYVSRTSDPQLHTHAVILNQTSYNGTLYAVDNIDLYKNKMLYGQIYRNYLAAELMKRGYEITVTDKEKGFFELKDIDEKLLQQFSTRRMQILEQLKEWSVSNTAENAAKAALTTRKAKEHKDMDLLIKSWKETIDEMGGMQLTKQLSAINTTPDDQQKSYQAALKSMSRRNFAFTEKALRKQVLAVGIGCCMTEEDAQKMMQGDPSIVNLGKQNGVENSPNYYTTKLNLKIENEILQEVAKNKGTVLGINKKTAQAILKKIEDPGALLSSEQRQAVLEIAQTNDRYFAVQGLAGTGKTYMLNYARQVLEHEGYVVKGACFTGKAADGLQTDAKIPSVTLHSHLNTLEKEAGNRNPLEDMEDKISWDFTGLKKSPSKEVWIVDEASMIDNFSMHNLMAAAEKKDAKVVFVGDDKQLLPVGVGNAYGTLVTTNKIGTVRIEEIRRQKNTELLHSVKEAVYGDINTSFQLIDKNIQEIAQPKKRLKAIVNEYISLSQEQQQATVILTAANEDRRILNKYIREELKNKNLLAEGKDFSIKDHSGRKAIREFSVGDKLIFLKNDNRLEIKNGQTGFVESIDNAYITVRNGNKTVTIDTAKYNHFDHGYAMTTHKAQGITVDRAIIHIDSSQRQMNSRNAFYVDISRARHEVKIFTDDKAKVKKQVKDFAKKITSRDFSISKSKTQSLYQTLKSATEKTLNRIHPSHEKSRDVKFTKN